MTEHDPSSSQSSDASPQPADIAEAEDVKPPERIRREEWFLMPWRFLLLAATIWAGVYAWIGLTWPEERLLELAAETIHGSLQRGVVIFLGAELAYYLYISASFRNCREWGMIIWGLGLLMMILNLRASI